MNISKNDSYEVATREWEVEAVNEQIHFTGYDEFVKLGLQSHADRIQVLFENDVREEETDLPLQQYSIDSYLKFCKLINLIKIKSGIGLSYEGNLSVNWYFPDGKGLSIKFLKNEKLLVVVITESVDKAFHSSLSEITEVLKEYKIL